VSNIVENGRNIGNADAGRVWHTDSSYMQVPSRGSCSTRSRCRRTTTASRWATPASRA
jgi:alpha-ketoglutarate-dependent taurine dioxygenase